MTTCPKFALFFGRGQGGVKMRGHKPHAPIVNPSDTVPVNGYCAC
jgi:hypothetical protein